MSDNRQRLMKWAQRRAAGEGGQAPAPPPAATPSAPALPPPPAGYAYAFKQDINAYILVPLNPQPLYQPPQVHYQPAPPPQGYQHAPPRPTRRVESCMIVKPGNADPYADFMEGVPELMPETASNYDAMQGNYSPESRAEMGKAGGFAPPVQAPNPEDNHYGNVRYQGTVTDLK